ncbi:MAG: MFS transporter [Candidatus Caldarchaeum sp.]
MASIRMLWAGSLLMGFSLMTMMQNAPIQAVLLEASFTDVGFLMGFVRNFLYVLLSPLTAVFLGHVKWNIPLPVSGLLMALVSMLMYFAGDLSMVLAAQLVMGVAMFCFFPCGESIVSYSFDGAGRLKAFSLFLSAVSAGFLLGSVFSGLVAYVFGLKQIFLLAAIVSASSSVLLAKANPSTIQMTTSNNGNILKTALPILYSAPFFLILAASYSVFPGYLILTGFTELDVGLLFFTLMLSRMLTSFGLSRMKPRNVKQLLIILSAATALSFIITSMYPSSFPSYVILLILIGAAVSVAYILTLYLVSEKTACQNPAFFIGMFEALIGFSFLTGPLVAGVLMDVYGFSAVLAVFGLSAVVGGLMNFRTRV